jgi:hypothetical protein
VPAFAFDLTSDGAYILRNHTFNGLIHMVDWLPTFLGWAGTPASEGTHIPWPFSLFLSFSSLYLSIYLSISLYGS